MATGLIVNTKVNVRREYYKQARSMCHALFQSDTFYINKKRVPAIVDSDNNKVISPNSTKTPAEVSQPENIVAGSINQLEGILSFIYQVKWPHDKRKIDEQKKEPTAITKLYGEFLFYKHFFSLDKPLIVCEGKTDIIYLKCALKQLKKEYGVLIKKNGDRFDFNIRFLNFSNNLKKVLAVSQGTSGLGSLMDIYEKYMKPFKGDGKKHPVIILVDNDSGSKSIKGRLKTNGREMTKPFTRFLENLYVVIIPPDSAGKERAIEDLFDKKTLSTKLGDKTFNRKQIESKTEYGKIVFAEKVVKADQNTINFDGFKDILNQFIEVIKDHKGKS
jgi:RNA-directed DNA polymerase